MSPDDRILSLADVVLDARPIDWGLVASTLPPEQRPLVANLQAVSRITSFHVESSLRADRTASVRSAAGSQPGLQPGEAWGPLTVVGPIGRGRYGDVYQAREPRLDRAVALKLLREAPDPETDAAAVIDEARLLARVRHPNVVAVFGAERIAGRVGLWMELVDGRTLEDELQERGPLPWREVVQIGRDLADALAAAHGAGLLHRDLKAHNVLRGTDGRIALADFGAGAIVAAAGDEPVELAGTPLYLAPEIFDGAPATRSSDIYSLGVLLFHLLTNSYPVRGRRLADLREAHAQRRRSTLADARSDLPRAVTDIVDRALAPTPEARWPHARDLQEALADAARAAETPHTDSPSTSHWPRWIWASAVTVGVVTLLAGGVAMRSDVQGREGRPVIARSGADRPGDLRKIRLPSYYMGRPSRDGAVYPFATQAGALHIFDVATGRSRQISDGGQPPEIGRATVASPAGDQVAYPWSHGQDGFELRAIRADGTWPRVLLARQTAYQPVPVDWSPDGREILCWLRQKNGSVDLVLVPAEGGRPRLLQTFESDWPLHGRLSPDGRLIAIGRAATPGAVTGDVFIMGTDGSAPHRVIENANIANAPTWMPDGRLVFMRPSAGAEGVTDAWAIHVGERSIEGQPSRLIQNVGFALIDITTRGELYRNLERVNSDVYTASVDLTGATPVGPPTRVSVEEVGHHVAPAWSPDGRLLAYFTISDRGIPGAVPERLLTVQEMATGSVRRLPLSLNFLTGYTPIWDPDGTSLLVLAKDTPDDARFGFYRVDVTTGGMTPFAILGPPKWPPFGAFDANGRRFVYSDGRRGLMVRDVAQRTEELVVSNGARDSIGQVATAPDSYAVAFQSSTLRDHRWTTAIEVWVAGRSPRTLRQVTAPLVVNLQGWTPDGRSVLYTIGEGPEHRALWRQPLDGGPPIDLQFAWTFSPNPISLSPDGRRIAYVERFVERELWITPLR